MAQPTPKVTFYTRKGCCLCEEAHAALVAAQKRVAFELQDVDIDADPELRSLYNDEIPLVAIDGRKVFQYRFQVDDLVKRLAGWK